MQQWIMSYDLIHVQLTGNDPIVYIGGGGGGGVICLFPNTIITLKVDFEVAHYVAFIWAFAVCQRRIQDSLVYKGLLVPKKSLIYILHNLKVCTFIILNVRLSVRPLAVSENAHNS